MNRIKKVLLGKNRKQAIALLAELRLEDLSEEDSELVEKLEYFILSTQDRAEAITRYKARVMKSLV